LNLEALLISPLGFALTTATPLQRAICRASTGEPLEELASDPDVIRAFGGESAIARLPSSSPKMFDTVAAVRCAKSIIEACKIVRWSQVVDVSDVRDGETPRIPIVSFRMDQAQAVYDHLVGALLRSPTLGQLLIGKPGKQCLFLRHPTGKPIEVRVIAGSRAGTTLVSRWLAGIVFDEAPRLQGQSDGIVNLDDALAAIQARILPGGQIDCAGSPWAPRGTIYDHFVEHFGFPSNDLVMVVAPGRAMNPYRYTDAFCAELERRDPRAYKTDVLAQFADLEDSLLSSADVIVCTRDKMIEGYDERFEYVAAMDPAMRTNAWTLVILCCSAPDTYSVVYTHQWQGSNSRPLKPSQVLREISFACREYHLDSAWSDQASFDALADTAEQCGLTLSQHAFTAALWESTAERLRALVGGRQLSLPPDATLRSDLLSVQRRLTSRGSSVVLGKTAGDNRHSDYVPALCLALAHAPSPPFVEVPDDRDDEQRLIDMLQSQQRTWDSGAAARLTGFQL